MSSIIFLNKSIVISCILGILLSAYALHVEIASEEDPSFEPFCNINEHISCTKAFSSEYGKGFGILNKVLGPSIFVQPNSVYGLFFYAFILLLSFFNYRTITRLMIILNILSNIGSVYLACILYFALSDFCFVCILTYVVNFINLILSLKKLKILSKENIKKLK